jgi:RNA polymerase sigma-70 factor (ECF subfamily)
VAGKALSLPEREIRRSLQRRSCSRTWILEEPGANELYMATALSLAMNDQLDRKFEIWIERNRSMVQRFFKRRGCTRDLVDELTQETLLVIWKKRADLRGDLERSFRAWAIKIAKTVWVKHWHRNRPPLEALAEGLEGTSADPEVLAEEQQLREALKAAIDELPPHEQACATWDLQGRPEKEIATLLGRAPGTVKAHLSHVRAKLQPIMKRFGPGAG